MANVRGLIIRKNGVYLRFIFVLDVNLFHFIVGYVDGMCGRAAKVLKAEHCQLNYSARGLLTFFDI